MANYYDDDFVERRRVPRDPYGRAVEGLSPARDTVGFQQSWEMGQGTGRPTQPAQTVPPRRPVKNRLQVTQEAKGRLARSQAAAAGDPRFQTRGLRMAGIPELNLLPYEPLGNTFNPGAPDQTFNRVQAERAARAPFEVGPPRPEGLASRGAAADPSFRGPPTREQAAAPQQSRPAGPSRSTVNPELNPYRHVTNDARIVAKLNELRSILEPVGYDLEKLRFSGRDQMRAAQLVQELGRLGIDNAADLVRVQSPINPLDPARNPQGLRDVRHLSNMASQGGAVSDVGPTQPKSLVAEQDLQRRIADASRMTQSNDLQVRQEGERLMRQLTQERTDLANRQREIDVRKGRSVGGIDASRITASEAGGVVSGVEPPDFNTTSNRGLRSRIDPNTEAAFDEKLKKLPPEARAAIQQEVVALENRAATVAEEARRIVGLREGQPFSRGPELTENLDARTQARYDKLKAEFEGLRGRLQQTMLGTAFPESAPSGVLETAADEARTRGNQARTVAGQAVEAAKDIPETVAREAGRASVEIPEAAVEGRAQAQAESARGRGAVPGEAAPPPAAEAAPPPAAEEPTASRTSPESSPAEKQGAFKKAYAASQGWAKGVWDALKGGPGKRAAAEQAAQQKKANSLRSKFAAQFKVRPALRAAIAAPFKAAGNPWVAAIGLTGEYAKLHAEEVKALLAENPDMSREDAQSIARSNVNSAVGEMLGHIPAEFQNDMNDWMRTAGFNPDEINTDEALGAFVSAMSGVPAAYEMAAQGVAAMPGLAATAFDVYIESPLRRLGAAITGEDLPPEEAVLQSYGGPISDMARGLSGYLTGLLESDSEGFGDLDIPDQETPQEAAVKQAVTPESELGPFGGPGPTIDPALGGPADEAITPAGLRRKYDAASDPDAAGFNRIVGGERAKPITGRDELRDEQGNTTGFEVTTPSGAGFIEAHGQRGRQSLRRALDGTGGGTFSVVDMSLARENREKEMGLRRQFLEDQDTRNYERQRQKLLKQISRGGRGRTKEERVADQKAKADALAALEDSRAKQSVAKATKSGFDAYKQMYKERQDAEAASQKAAELFSDPKAMAQIAGRILAGSASPVEKGHFDSAMFQGIAAQLSKDFNPGFFGFTQDRGVARSYADIVGMGIDPFAAFRIDETGTDWFLDAEIESANDLGAFFDRAVGKGVLRNMLEQWGVPSTQYDAMMNWLFNRIEQANTGEIDEAKRLKIFQGGA